MSPVHNRIRNEFKDYNVVSTYTGGPQYTKVIRQWDYYHWMADSINQRSVEKGRYAPGPCQHLKCDKTYIASTLVQTNRVTGISNTQTNPANWTLNPSGSKTQSPTGSSVPWYDADYGYSNLAIDFLKTPRFQDLCFEAWTKLKTQIPAEISVLNFIYELKDFVPLAKSLSKIPQSVRDSNLSKTFTDPLKGKGKIKKSAKAVNSSFLAYNFTWAPFVGDIQKLTTISDSVAKRMAFLLNSKGKEVTIRFSKPDCFVNDQLEREQEIAYQDSDWRTAFKMTKYQCDFYVTAKLYQDLEGLDDTFASLRATIAALGINNPAKAVWNAIPFSFLLDWVGPFGKWLERASVQPFFGVWKVYDITTSVRERYDIEMFVEDRSSSTNPGTPLLVPRTVLEKVSVDKYTRLVGLPQTLGALDFSQLTSQQQKLFLSLVLTKVL